MDKIKIVVDTNIFISAFLGSKNAKLLLREIISDENSESCWVKKDKVLGMITTPAIRQRFKAYLDYDGNVQYLPYITQPEFNLEIIRKI